MSAEREIERMCEGMVRGIIEVAKVVKKPLDDEVDRLQAEVDRLREQLQAAESRIKELAELLVDAELITRSRCKELTGMSHHEIAMLLADSPIGREVRRETAEECAKIAEQFIGCEEGDHPCRVAREIRARFVEGEK